MSKARHFEIDHTKKYKVFNLYNSENEVVTRVSGSRGASILENAPSTCRSGMFCSLRKI